MKKKEILFCAILLFIDQLSKYFMEKILVHGSITIIPNFFSLVFMKNTGAAWSILDGHSFLLAITSVILIFLLAWFYPTVKDCRLKSFSFSLLYAGIIGNFLDRIIFSCVKDFLSFHIFGYDFPVFNFADIFIVFGIFLMIILIWKGEKDDERMDR